MSEDAPHPHGGIEFVMVDLVSVRLFALVQRLASFDSSPVFVHGEGGTGKSAIAQMLHQHSPRRRGPFVTVSCASLSEPSATPAMLERLLDVAAAPPAKDAHGFEAAHGGTLLFDEVGDLSAQGQVELLHVLKHRERSAPMQGEPRLICTSRRDLAADVRHGRFRADLFFRFNALSIAVPPLRERSADILPVAQRVLALRAPRVSLEPESIDRLMKHPWPGNYRELIHAVMTAAALADGGPVQESHLMRALRRRSDDPSSDADPPPMPKLWQIERQAILDALERHRGDAAGAARELGIHHRMFLKRITRYNLHDRVSRPGDRR